MELKTGKLIKFNNAKDFKYLNILGKGGTGQTHLFLDETTDIKFAIKKYYPVQTEYKKILYERFVNEIKILFNISHPNIVRIYNYYLYPSSYAGYLQMEYIEGISINDYNPWIFDKQWEDIFIEAISAFRYLETKNILHRDIRATNIMINNNQEVKIIDFGFGKISNNAEDLKNSILLNWPVTELPEEILVNEDYTKQSEIYFLGKTFYTILKEKKELENFKFKFILDKMIKIQLSERYSSFSEIEQDISSGLISNTLFTDEEKEIYLEFAKSIELSISSFKIGYNFIDDIQSILANLNKLINSNILEPFIQENSNLIRIFVKGTYTYRTTKIVKTETVRKFYIFLYGLSLKKQTIVLDNLFSRLSTIEVIDDNSISDDDFPF